MVQGGGSRVQGGGFIAVKLVRVSSALGVPGSAAASDLPCTRAHIRSRPDP
jgi:uncharacterized protein GlcG (DUF336 family)